MFPARPSPHADPTLVVEAPTLSAGDWYLVHLALTGKLEREHEPLAQRLGLRLHALFAEFVEDRCLRSPRVAERRPHEADAA